MRWGWRAYPRSHGATFNNPPVRSTQKGLSPLARGNPFGALSHALSCGPIPARTGQPGQKPWPSCALGAYPRSHGATIAPDGVTGIRLGLSPLARGNRAIGSRDVNNYGPIPARTGQPVTAQMFEDAFGAYPRSHGATSCVVPASFTDKGLSPLARGNLPEAESARAALRPIPARTGQPTASRCLPLLWRAYPRSHGATEWGRTERAKIGGLSPLARGNPRLARLQSACARPIPARTGQPCSKPMRRVFERAYPRSHGATSWQVSDLLLSQGLSPLARGNRTASDAQIALKGPIPARTGQP